MAPPIRSNRGQPPSLYGRIQVDATRGTLRVRIWPRKRGKSLPQKTKDQNEWFRQAQWLAKYATPEQQRIAREGTEGTPLMPRDVLTSAMSGRFIATQTPDGKWIYGMPIKVDVSKDLDLLGLDVGSVLIRGEDIWYALPPAANGFVLTSAGPEKTPEWRPPVSGQDTEGAVTAIDVPNPGFETGDFTDWELVSGDAEVNNDEAHSGLFSAEIGIGGSHFRTKNPLVIPEAFHDAIDADEVTSRLIWYQGGGTFRADGGARLEVLDAQNNRVAMTATDNTSVPSWTSREKELHLPPGSRKFIIHQTSGGGTLGPTGARFDDFNILVLNDTLFTDLGLQLPRLSISLLPTPAPSGKKIFVLDTVDGGRECYSDGENWRRTDTNNIVE